MYRLCSILAFALITHSVVASTKIIVAISDFPPSIDLSKKNFGIHGKIVLDALKKAEQTFEIKIYSWSKIETLLNTADVCSFGWVKNNSRMSRWYYSKPYHSDVSYLWGRKDNPIKLDTLADAGRYRIGVTRGFSYGQNFDDLMAKIEVDEGPDDTVNLKKLLAGRIDFFPGQGLIIRPILRSRFATRLDELEPKMQINILSHHFVCNIKYALGRDAIKKLNVFLPSG